MKKFQIGLQKYTGPASRFRCPQCEQPGEFTRYINTDTGACFGDDFGRCNRTAKCGYDKRPTEIPGAEDLKTKLVHVRKPEPQPVFIPLEEVKSCRVDYKNNSYVQYLVGKYGKAAAQDATSMYNIGTNSDHHIGSAVFWFTDVNGNHRAGQLKQFDASGHTVNTSWYHTAITIRNKHHSLPDWLVKYEKYKSDGGKIVTCLFGEHLIGKYKAKKIGLVEAPATAIEASIYCPEYLWLAVGALGWFNEQSLKALKHRSVFVIPDLSLPDKDGKTTFDHWRIKGEKYSAITKFQFCDIVEQIADAQSKEERQRFCLRKNGQDLRDILCKHDLPTFPGLEALRPSKNVTEAIQEIPINPVDGVAELSSLKHLVEKAETIQETLPPFVPPLQIEKQVHHKEVWPVSHYEEFFKENENLIPSEPWFLDRATTVRLKGENGMLRGHLEIVKGNNGKPTFLPYWERLVKVYEFVQEERRAKLEREQKIKTQNEKAKESIR